MRTRVQKRRSSDWTTGSSLDREEDSIAPHSDMEIEELPSLNATVDSMDFLNLLT